MKSIFIFIGLLLAVPPLIAQTATGTITRTVTGTVCDAQTQEPLVGASVLQKDTRNGVATNADGRFELRLLPSNRQVHTVRSLGYTTAEYDLSNAAHSIR